MSVGTYGLLSQRAAKADFDEFVNPGATMPSCFTSLQDKGGSKCKEYYDRSQSARKLAIGGFAAGGVLAAGAIVGFVLSSGDGGTGGERVTYTFATDGRGGAGGWTLRF
jgi:hypothetical protein